MDAPFRGLKPTAILTSSLRDGESFSVWIERRKRLEPRESGRQLEQQRRQLPVGESQQERARQSQRQPRFPPSERSTLPEAPCSRMRRARSRSSPGIHPAPDGSITCPAKQQWPAACGRPEPGSTPAASRYCTVRGKRKSKSITSMADEEGGDFNGVEWLSQYPSPLRLRVRRRSPRSCKQDGRHLPLRKPSRPTFAGVDQL